MENKNFYEYLRQNLNSIYNNFKTVFKINSEEFSIIMKLIINNVSNDKFYKNLLDKKDVIDIFDKNSLLKIKNYFLSLPLSEDVIKKIILTSPQIIFYYDQLDNVFAIYKNTSFKGLVFVDEDKYKSYSFSNNNYQLVNLDNLDVNSYDYLVNDMLSSLEREDIKKSLNFYPNEETELIKKMNALTKEYSKKNYYFKKRKH